MRMDLPFLGTIFVGAFIGGLTLGLLLGDVSAPPGQEAALRTAPGRTVGQGTPRPRVATTERRPSGQATQRPQGAAQPGPQARPARKTPAHRVIPARQRAQFLVQIGPIADLDEATALAERLTRQGFHPEMSRRALGGTVGFVITLGPYDARAVEQIVAVLAAQDDERP